jgi:hypothetical protein
MMIDEFKIILFLYAIGGGIIVFLSFASLVVVSKIPSNYRKGSFLKFLKKESIEGIDDEKMKKRLFLLKKIYWTTLLFIVLFFILVIISLLVFNKIYRKLVIYPV